MTHLLAATGDGPVTSFGNEPFWIIIVKAVAIFGILVLLTLLTIWGERRVVGRMQQRVGPNRVGPFGVIQGLADGIKLALKEDIIPVLADKPVFIIAPVVSTIPAFLAFAVVPFGPEVSIAGNQTSLQLTDLPVGVLFVLAMSSLGVYGIVLGGWASGSIYPLLGGLRSAAQMISYEISMGLSLVTVFLFAGSLSTSRIVGAQDDLWNVLPLSISFVIYAISVVGETNRAPFDLPEAESELVGGFHTEYSSLKFALFFLAEYVNLITVSAIGATLFFGGWRPFWPFSLVDAFSTGWWPLVFFLAKVIVGIFGFIWLRGTLPRLRYDQFMRFGWKVLVPGALVWTLLVATMRTLGTEGALSARNVLIGGGALAVVVLALSFLPERTPEPAVEPVQGHPAGLVSGGYPVPSLPLRHAPPTAASDRPVVIGSGGPALTSNDDPGDTSAR